MVKKCVSPTKLNKVEVMNTLQAIYFATGIAVFIYIIYYNRDKFTASKPVIQY
jgi:hypothetical protein